METVYKRQQEKGGIIDIEAEKNKYLLSSVSSFTSQNVLFNGISVNMDTNSVKRNMKPIILLILDPLTI